MRGRRGHIAAVAAEAGLVPETIYGTRGASADCWRASSTASALARIAEPLVAVHGTYHHPFRRVHSSRIADMTSMTTRIQTSVPTAVAS